MPTELLYDYISRQLAIPVAVTIWKLALANPSVETEMTYDIAGY